MANARRNDPITSHQAGADFKKSKPTIRYIGQDGRRFKQLAKTPLHLVVILDVLNSYQRDKKMQVETFGNGLTTKEIAHLTNFLTHPQIHKRMIDLERSGYIIRPFKRECAFTGTPCLVSKITEKGYRFLQDMKEDCAA